MHGRDRISNARRQKKLEDSDGSLKTRRLPSRLILAMSFDDLLW
jgi:hypothetical protein